MSDRVEPHLWFRDQKWLGNTQSWVEEPVSASVSVIAVLSGIPIPGKSPLFYRIKIKDVIGLQSFDHFEDALEIAQMHQRD